MRVNKRIVFLIVAVAAMFVITACGSLNDESSVWSIENPLWDELQTEEAASNEADGTSSVITFLPGTYEATSEISGYYGPITVMVTVDDDGRISNIEVTDHVESGDHIQRVLNNLPPLIIAEQTWDVDVDAASGATYSATAFLSAVNVALEEANDGESAGTTDQNSVVSFTPGTFEATSEISGYYGPITVMVTIGDDGRISDIEVTDHVESSDHIQRVLNNLPPLIIDEQTNDVDVDAASGATYSANAFLDAVGNALENAQ